MNSELLQLLEVSSGRGIRELRPTHGSSFCQTSLVVFHDGSYGFLKHSQANAADYFQAEARGLRVLQETGCLLVPEVFAADTLRDGTSFILLQYLEPGARDTRGEEQLAVGLAKLHRVSAKQYGFSSDNFIGLTPQSNKYGETWGEFFMEQRLLFQAKIGKSRGWFSADDEEALSRLSTLIVRRLNEHKPEPSLLHGDLWSGNVLFSQRGPVLIDPAVYFGDREADIAFTELFGGFSPQFYQAYNQAWPLAEGYEGRKEILNLYHLMNHANLFGGSYASQVKQQLSRFH